METFKRSLDQVTMLVKGTRLKLEVDILEPGEEPGEEYDEAESWMVK